jgi:hypothetical protein
MPRRTAAAALALALLAAARTALACSLCMNQQALTLRQEAAQSTARLVLLGTLHHADYKAGTTELHVTDVLRPDPSLAGRKVVVIPRWMPVDDKNPPRFLVFCDVFKGKLDPYRGVPVKTADAAEYLKKAMALDPNDRAGGLQFFFRYLEHPDDEVARDAFLEFAKATDQDIGRVAPRLDPAKLRGWLKDPRTPTERLGVYAVLLGACGGAEDAALLEGMLKQPGERTQTAYDGLLAGYMHLRPREGWGLARATLGDGTRPLPVRLAVLRTLRFYHGSRPAESRPNVLSGMGAVLRQGELADVAMEDLRRWGMWDLTDEVLGLYGKKGFDGPLLRRAVVRYALACRDAGDEPRREKAAAFVAERQRQEPDLVKDVQEELDAEKPRQQPPSGAP